MKRLASIVKLVICSAAGRLNLSGVTVALLEGFCPAASTQAQSVQRVGAPGVFALAIGVSDYDDGPLVRAAPNAIRFVSAVTNCYTNTQLMLLTNKQATLGKVESCLFDTMANAPPGSLLIYYFSGHEIRVDDDGRLLLYGSTQGDFWGRTVSVSEIVSSIRHAKQCTAMIFLDCCCS